MGMTKSMLAQSIYNLEPAFLKLEQQCGFNVCGEGGEYESIVLDCPLFKRRLEIVDLSIVDLGNDYNVCSYVIIEEVIAVEKTQAECEKDLQTLEQMRLKYSPPQSPVFQSMPSKCYKMS
jgi:diphthine-ammonia ligase